MQSDEYNEGYKSGKSETRGLSPRAAQTYLEMVAPRAGDEFDAGHRAAFVERAVQS